MTACRCGRAVRFVPSVGFYGHVEPLPRGRGHYVRLSTSAPAVTGHGAEAGGAVRAESRSAGLRRSRLAKAG